MNEMTADLLKQQVDQLQRLISAANERLDQLAVENSKLRGEIDLLTTIIRDNASKVPYLPGYVPIPTQLPPLTPLEQNCPKCGLKLEGVMGYVCTQAYCPTGLGGAWSMT